MIRYPVMPSFPPPDACPNRPSLYPTEADFVTGDPRGLYELAGRIYEYVSAHSMPTVDVLVQTVKQLVKDDNEPGGYTPGPDGGWIGATAFRFRDTFVSDAAMMNGLNRVLCKVAEAVDELASGLSELECRLETTLEREIGSRVPGFSVNWLVAKGTGTQPYLDYTALARPIAGDASRMAQIRTACNLIAKPIFAEADKRRHTAASKLSALGAILEEAFDYYSNYSASPGSPMTMDPSILLTSGQAAADAQATKQLHDKYAQLTGKLNASSLDGDAVKSVLSGLGVTGEKGGKILNGIKDIRDASTALGRGGKFLSLVGDAIPVLMAIGMAAA